MCRLLIWQSGPGAQPYACLRQTTPLPHGQPAMLHAARSRVLCLWCVGLLSAAAQARTLRQFAHVHKPPGAQQHSILSEPQPGRQAASGHAGSRLRKHFMSLAAPILEPGSQLSGRAQTSLAMLWATGAQSTSQEEDQGMSEQLSSTWKQLLATSYAVPAQRVKAAAVSQAGHETQEEPQRETEVEQGERGGGWDGGEGDKDQLEEQHDTEG